MHDVAAYPFARAGRDRFVLDHRPPRQARDPWRHQGVRVEDERAADGGIVRAATVFLTGRECPWRCVMCDLWAFTIEEDTPRGALVRQVQAARRQLDDAGPLPAHVKLYNAGSFFDPRAVPESDYAPIAAALRGVRHLVVESHPLLVGSRLRRFRDAWHFAGSAADAPSLEVAMGLETAHPAALDRLHKRFTLEQFARAADRLRREGVDLRVFLLVGVPFLSSGEQLEWLQRSTAFAFECGASVVSLVPTRTGNGAVDALARAGAFVPPSLADLEGALERALPDARGRVFADVWDLERLAKCPACFEARRARLQRMNLEQRLYPRVTCQDCRSAEGRR